MNGKLKIKLGENILELSGDGKQNDVIKHLAFWSQLPKVCGLCKSKNISLSHRSPGGDDYFGLKCCDCTAELTFHHAKIGGFYILPTDVWKIWKKDSAQNTDRVDSKHAAKPTSAKEIYDEIPPPTDADIPF